MSKLQYEIGTIVLQPTSLCNLMCTYCYLPDIDKNLRMAADITRTIATQIENSQNSVDILWHAGEPLMCGLEHFRELISPFEDLLKDGRVKHVIQTNATLLNDEWCQLFRDNQFHIGVSIDGPEWANRNRVGKNGREQYLKIHQGILTLKRNGLPFTVIAVVDESSICRAKELYSYFADLGCKWLGINIEENECANVRVVKDDSSVEMFWAELFEAWQADLRVEIREFTKILYWMNTILAKKTYDLSNTRYDLFPTVAFNGDFVFLSPELLGGSSPSHNNFVVGNVMQDSLFGHAERANDISYVSDYNEGVFQCSMECDYFSLCKGGQASNKFYENGSLATTQTAYCRNSVIRPAIAVLDRFLR